MTKKWVLINNNNECEFILGIYDNEFEAIGKAHCHMAEFATNYKDKDDKFIIYPMEDDGYDGYFIIIEFQAYGWEHSEQEVYRILPYTGDK